MLPKCLIKVPLFSFSYFGVADETTEDVESDEWEEEEEVEPKVLLLFIYLLIYRKSLCSYTIVEFVFS